MMCRYPPFSLEAKTTYHKQISILLSGAGAHLAKKKEVGPKASYLHFSLFQTSMDDQ